MLFVKEETMKILIRKDAVDLYVKDHTDYNGEYFGDDEWERTLEFIAGKEVEVDTDMLFKDEFNTMPIPGVSEEGIRVPIEYVTKIINDKRHGKARCDFCNEVSNSTEKCTNCGRTDYLEPFFDNEY